MATIKIEGVSKEEFEKNQAVMSEVIAKYYGDPDFKAKVDGNPTAALKAEGLSIPAGTEVKLLFNTDKLIHVVLPARAV